MKKLAMIAALGLGATMMAAAAPLPADVRPLEGTTGYGGPSRNSRKKPKGKARTKSKAQIARKARNRGARRAARR